MKTYQTSHRENNFIKEARRMLVQDQDLAQAYGQAGIDTNNLWDPEHAYYLADAPYAKPSQNMEQVLRTHLCNCLKSGGYLQTQTIEQWERYPLEFLIRLLWRMRDTEGEVQFLRGDAGIHEPPIMWKAELCWEQGERVLYCYDEENRNRMFMTLRYAGQWLDPKEFFSELQSFLRFPEDAVWICNHSTRKIEEVIT